MQVSTRKHTYTLRMYFEDTDALGIVYHANYLNFAERARTEMLRECGVLHAKMAVEDQMAFVIRQCRLDYYKPGFLDDILTIHTYVSQQTAMTISMQQDILRTQDQIVQLNTKLACVNRDKKPIKIPQDVLKALEDNNFM